MTEHILNINTEVDDTDGRTSEAPDVSNYSVGLTMVISLCLHAIAFFILARFSGIGELVTTPETPVQTIKAHLYFPPPVHEQVPPEQTTEPPVKPEPVEIKATIAEVQETELNQETIHPTPEPASDNVPEASPTPSFEVSADEAQSRESSQYTRAQRLSNALSSHLKALEQEQMGNLETEMTRNRDQIRYQQSIARAKIPEEPKPELKTKRIDCTSTTGEIAGLLSGLAGGTLRCSEQPDFQKYIDARLNKNSEIK